MALSDVQAPPKKLPPDALVIAMLCLLQAFMPLAIDAYLPALPQIAREFGVAQDQVQLTLSLYMITVAVGQLLWGPLSDLTGRRAPLVCGIVLFILGSAGAALAATNNQLIAARMVQATGGGAVATLTRAIASDVFKGPRLARVFSTMMIVVSLAPMIAPIAGGQIMALWDWRGIFWMLAGIAGLALAGLTLIPETLPVHQRGGGLAPVLVAYGGLLRDRRFMGYGVCGGLIFGCMFAYIAGTPFVYIDIFHVTPEHYGFLFGLNVMGMMALGALNRRLVMTWPPDRVLRGGVLLAATAALVLVASAVLRIGGLWGVVVPLFFCCSTIGLIAPNVMAGGMSSAGRAAGAASGLLGSFQVIFGAVSGWVVGLLANGTAIPMAGVMCALVLAALAVNLWAGRASRV